MLPPAARIVIALVGGYLLGSIPFGLIAARLGGAGDIRAIGSGNIGATNVLRTGRRDLALITLVGDAGKGVAAVLLASAFLGHVFPVWLRFNGGKGVATFFGVVFAVAWPVGLAAGATWIVMAAVFRFSSLAALTAAALAPVWLLLLWPGRPAALVLLVGMALLIFLRHQANIRRLLRREEPRIGASSRATP